MMRNVLTLVAATLVAAACQTAPAHDAAPAEPAFTDDDGWVMVIEAERYGVLIERALQGAIEGPPAHTAPEPSDRLRAGLATRHAAFRLYELKEHVCRSGQTSGDHCGPLPPPEWLGAPHYDEPEWSEIRARIDWLTAHMWPFVEAGCDAGRSRQTGDEPDYCAVE